MTRTFTDPLWKRTIIVDDAGIHEHRRGRVVRSIHWEDLRSVRGDEIRGVRGTRISPWLKPPERRELVKYANEIWKQRYPERWEEGRRRAKKDADWAIYFWLPLLTFGPCIAICILYWICGSPEDFRPRFEESCRLMVIALVLLGPMTIWYARKVRKTM